MTANTAIGCAILNRFGQQLSVLDQRYARCWRRGIDAENSHPPTCFSKNLTMSL